MMSHELTIVLLLKDQTSFTWRWFDFYNQHPLPYKILIADGGSDRSVEKLKDTTLYPNLDYEYIRYPYDETRRDYYQKLADVASRVTTPFCLLASNHDFYLVQSVGESIAFLKQNPAYSSARGEVYDITVQSRQTPGEYTYGEIKHIQKTYSNPPNIADNSLVRLEEFSRNSNSLWHDVNRTDNLQQAFRELQKSEIEDIALAEYLLNSLIVLTGKVHRSPGLYMLHQELPGGMGLYVTKQDPIELLTTNTWLDQFLQAINILSDRVAADCGLPKMKAHETILTFYLTNTLKKRLRRSVSTTQSPLIQLGRIFPKQSFVRKFFKKIYRQIKNTSIGSGMETFPYHQSISQIQAFLTTNDKKRPGMLPGPERN